MAMTIAQANDAVKEGIRRALDRGSLPQEEYDAKTIKELRKDLKDSLGDDVPNENDRLDFLDISIRRRCRKAGWRVKTPSRDWYTAPANQEKRVAVIADFIVSNPMQPV